jgi:hypothetical protein
VPVIFYTATYREREAMAVAQTCGVRWVLPKPSDPEVIAAPCRKRWACRPSWRRPGYAGAAAGGPLPHIDHKVAEYLDELENSSRQLRASPTRRAKSIARRRTPVAHDAAAVAVRCPACRR